MDDFIFAKEDVISEINSIATEGMCCWNVLIVDDDPMVHEVTQSVLNDVIIDDRKVNFIDAYSAKDAIEILKNNDNIAVIFLDVVMETEDAGLSLCEVIRNELNNDMIQIILRTGQPGSNPEKEVVLKYKINDYKEKTELTAQKLFTCLVGAVRSYQGLVKVAQNKSGLDKIIAATQQLNKKTSVPLLMDGLLGQLTTIIDYCERSFVFEVVNSSSFETLLTPQDVRLMSCFGAENIEHFDNFLITLKERVVIDRKTYEPSLHDKEYLCSFNYGKKCQYVLYLKAGRSLTLLDLELLHVFSSNIQVALDGLYRHQFVIESQQNTIEQLRKMISGSAECRVLNSRDFTTFCTLLALDFGVSRAQAETFTQALEAKRLLLGSEQLTDHPKHSFPVVERQHIGTAGKINQSMLSTTNMLIQHRNERFDGSGYPIGLMGEAIPVMCRVDALARAFFGVVDNTNFRKPWDQTQIDQLFVQESGRHFDPALCEIVRLNLDKYYELATRSNG